MPDLNATADRAFAPKSAGAAATSWQVSAVSCLGLGLPDVPASPQVASSCVPGEAGKVARYFAWLGQVEGALSEPLVVDGAGGP